MCSSEAEAQGTVELVRGDWVLTSSCHPATAHLSVQSMCLLESELEAQLGEFHLRMKGTEREADWRPGEGSVCLRPLDPAHLLLPDSQDWPASPGYVLATSMR